MWIRRIKIQRLSGKTRKKKEDQLILDREFILNINNKQIPFTCVPSNIKEMMIGYIFHNQIIHSINEIKEIKTKDNIIQINTKKIDLPKKVEPKKNNYTLSAENLYSKMYDFQDQSHLFKESAITHSASFADENQLLCFSEDIERLQACYKAIGIALSEKITLTNKWFLCSSKIDRPLIKTLLELGIRHIISRVAPTNEAYEIAKTFNCTLIGFCRAQKCNLYCGTIN